MRTAWAEALPAVPQTVIAYILDGAWKASTSTLSARLAAIAEKHRGHPNPSADDRVKEIMRGVRRTHGRPPTPKEPALAEDVRAVVDVQPTDILAGTRNRALLLFGYASAMRRSEIVAVDVEYLKFTREGLTPGDSDSGMFGG